MPRRTTGKEIKRERERETGGGRRGHGEKRMKGGIGTAGRQNSSKKHVTSRLSRTNGRKDTAISIKNERKANLTNFVIHHSAIRTHQPGVVTLPVITFDNTPAAIALRGVDEVNDDDGMSYENAPPFPKKVNGVSACACTFSNDASLFSTKWGNILSIYT